ncbi:MAG TPA: DEAD/DEAH box helicase [Treponemataceae bacterium]|nr:DEAD/DEAH box helicase [Treponemataceae bacterium]
MEFIEFSLHDTLLKGIAKAGYKTCTEVQERVIKTALNKEDVYVQSQTGTGKTAAYLITIIQEMLVETDENRKQALIMVPTRELAVQVEEEASILLSATKLQAASFYGGVGYGKQVDMLKKGVDIMIGTPGRVIDLNESGQMRFNKVGYLVIDEADRMFDMGFYPDLRKLIKVLPTDKARQTMLFSATLNTYVKNLAWEYTTDAQEIEVETDNITVDEIDQLLFHVSSDEKMQLLLGIIEKEKPDSLIVFCNTKRACEVVAQRIKMNGIECEFIIGDLPQSKRMQVLDSFKRASLKCLVATDVAARGIDIDDLSMVINYDLPNETENYVHRIGRTARAGKTGKAYTFCSEQDVYNLPAIERYMGDSIKSEVAGPELLVKDKSAGTYIRTGRFRDDRGSQNRSRSTSQKFDKRDNRKSSSRPNEQRNRRSNYKTNNDEYRNKRHQRDERPSSQHRNTKSDESKSSVGSIDMSQMSFEERMKLYKEKYSTPSSQHAGTTKTRTRTSGSANKPRDNQGGTNSAPAPNKKRNKKTETPHIKNSHNTQENYKKIRTNKQHAKPAQNNASKQQEKPAQKNGNKQQEKPRRKGVGNIFTRMFKLY